MKNICIILFSTFIIVYGSCQKENSNNILIEKYERLYGQWEPASIIGGKSGNGVTPDFKLFYIETNNNFTVMADEILCTGELSIFKQTNDTLIIKLLAKKGSHMLALSCKKLTSFSLDTLIFDETIDCTDSYRFKLIKKKL